MKLKKLAGKISALLLITMCCTLTKTSAENTNLYGTCLKGTQTNSQGGTEIVISEIDESISGSRYDKAYNARITGALRSLRKCCKIPIFKITFEGITYELCHGSGELIISGCIGCSPELKKSVLNVIGAMPLFEPETKEVRRWNVQKGKWEIVETIKYRSLGPSEPIQKVTFRGAIRFIPNYFLKLCYPVDPEGFDCDSPNSIHPQIIDLSDSNIERIGYKAFNISGIQKVILPEHTVQIESYEYETTIGYEKDNTQIENSEYARYQEPPSVGPDPYDNSCCILI